jgi:methionyl-tRNA synthetase
MRKEDPPKAAAVIRNLCYMVRDLAVLIEPYMPAAAAKTASFFGLSLGRDLSWNDIGRDDGIKPGIKIRSEVLFSKLEDDLVKELRERYSGSQKERGETAAAGAVDKTGAAAAKAAPVPPPPKDPEEIAASFAETLDLRVAEIVKIERHPKADKLYIETLETAAGVTGVPEERIIVSGLVPFYREDELLGKRIIVAYNLKPAKFRGVESRGMLLAAADHGGEGGAGRVEVLDAAGVPTGTPVKLAGAAGDKPPAEIAIDAFFAVPITVRDYQVEAGGRALTLLGNPIRTRMVASGEVR